MYILPVTFIIILKVTKVLTVIIQGHSIVCPGAEVKIFDRSYYQYLTVCVNLVLHSNGKATTLTLITDTVIVQFLKDTYVVSIR